jgi:DNA polymerase-3 subunit alpha
MAVFVLEDLDSAIETMVFPRTMTEYGPLLDDDAVVVVKGRIDAREDTPKLIAMEIRRPVLVPEGETRPLRVRVPAERITGSLADRIREILQRHPGPAEVRLEVGRKAIRLPDGYRVDPTSGVVAELRELLGAGAVIS